MGLRFENAGWSLTQATEAAGVSDRTAAKWLAARQVDRKAADA